MPDIQYKRLQHEAGACQEPQAPVEHVAHMFNEIGRLRSGCTPQTRNKKCLNTKSRLRNYDFWTRKSKTHLRILHPSRDNCRKTAPRRAMELSRKKIKAAQPSRGVWRARGSPKSAMIAPKIIKRYEISYSQLNTWMS